MSDRYTAANWYWVVDGNTTQVYSSATAAYVPLSDATYVGWLANGNIPTAIDTEASLQDVLAQQYPAGWPQTIIQQAAAALDAPFCIISTTLGLSATPTYPNGIPFKINGNTQGHINFNPSYRINLLSVVLVVFFFAQFEIILSFLIVCFFLFFSVFFIVCVELSTFLSE